MNTKEAIEFLKSQIYSAEDLKNIYHLDSDMTSKEKRGYLESLTHNKEFKEVIELLKRGERNEKHKQMWVELEVYIEGKSEALTNKMNTLEQKYFPKIKKTIIIEIEANNENVIKWAEHQIKDLENNVWNHLLKVNILKKGGNQ